MERKRNYIEKVQDWADDCLRRMCGRITPGKRLAVILPLHGNDTTKSINPLNRPEYGRNTEE